MRTETPPRQTPTRLADHRPPDWLVDEVRLAFDLAPRATVVRARVAFRRNPARAAEGPAALRLDGRKLTLRSAAIDGETVPGAAIALDAEGLTVPADRLPGDVFSWECETEIDPAANTELEGLYLSKGMYCTQCEAEGFRKITYYPDRPDVMAPFHVRIEADAETPVLLSNGNPAGHGTTPEGRLWAEWDDPFPKPSYLFALVAGDLVAHEDRFATMSGRQVALKLWVRPGDEDRCGYAMDSLERAMRWDEEAYGREYDLDLFQIVAVDDFNMGAMENKGLNIFNSKFVLASPETATDADYERIESIVAHEYFHNWTGNRITCRDWFQLCLKEGLTVFRDQQFSADMRSAPVQRIRDVKALRARQFPEDEGPLAHPVRPEEYVEINNFYSATVYEKGAEIIRMLRALVGEEGYRAALDLYFERHDGDAATVEDFRRCFEDACGRDLSQFALWWSQAGTPRLRVEDAWDGETLAVTLRQETPPTPGQPEKRPFHMPVALAVLGPDGTERVAPRVVELREAEETFSFAIGALGAPDGSAPARPVLSVNRGFSAPVILERDASDAEDAFLLAHDTDPFNRWEAGHRYALRIARAVSEEAADVPEPWVAALGRVLGEAALDPAFRALALELPGQDEVAGAAAAAGRAADPEAIFGALERMRCTLSHRLGDALAGAHDRLAPAGAYSPDAASAGRRALANRCLALLMAGGEPAAEERAARQYDTAESMTDRMAALAALVHRDADAAGDRLAAFHARWRADPNVLDKWFTVQATAPVPDAVDRVEALTGHADFDWRTPNRFRAVIGAFAMANPVRFHGADGRGYRLVADWLLRLDPVNPQTAARLAGAFESWRRYDAARQEMMRAELERIAGTEGLSRNTGEMVARMLGES